MEFLSLEKYSGDKKGKNSPKRLKRKIKTDDNKKCKKSRSIVKKKLRSSKTDDIHVGNKSVTENLPNEVSQQMEKVHEEKTSEEIQFPRLFVNMKRVIMNEDEVKEIHPDVISVRFPRKKRSRWCWAVFHSEKKAAKALTELKERKDIIVNQPHGPTKRISNKNKNLKSKLRKSVKSKLRQAWM